jgi:hypothetical protein
MRRPRDDRQNDLFQPLHETSSICASMVRLAEEVDCDFLGRAFRPGSAARPRPAAVADAEERTAGLLKIAVNYRKKLGEAPSSTARPLSKLALPAVQSCNAR